MNTREKIAEQQAELAVLNNIYKKDLLKWTTEETIMYGNKEAVSIKKDLVDVSIQQLAVELLFEKDFAAWSSAEKRRYGNQEEAALEQLREKSKQLREKEKQLREEEKQLREQQIILLQLKEKTLVQGSKSPIQGFVDAGQSSSFTQQIEDIKADISKLQESSSKLQESDSKLQESSSKLQETVSNYIQKVETIQISKLTIDKIQKDGYTLIASSVNSINDSDYKIADEFHEFQWPVKNSEKDKKTKTHILDTYRHLLNHLNTSKPRLQSNGLISTLNRNQLLMVFEMKIGSINSNNLAQAIGYVVAANSLFDVPGRPSPVGVLSDFIDQWCLIWISKDGEVIYANMEKDSELHGKPLTRLTAMYYIQKHLEHYNQLLNDENTKKRRAEHTGWAFDEFEAGTLKKQMVLVAEDNMRDLLETDEEIAMYDMRKRMRNTPLFCIPPPAEKLSYFS
ncbi:hypothetical protein O5D80_003361 [Batrachochytrium dendrobatidis]|nr:hypothetical protein O5D80_004159 [Batrachochytrium dendrobatidis]KAJ8327975.1 hypothetical protein O5D80_003361 [Batrachochytrium dendrobatidis]